MSGDSAIMCRVVDMNAHGTPKGVEGTLKQLLANLVVAKYVAQGAHWNVTGKDFGPYHAFFQEIYETYEEMIDAVAEAMRFVGGAPCTTLKDFLELDTIKATDLTPRDSMAMSREVHRANEVLHDNAESVCDAADAVGEEAICNKAQELMYDLQKIDWKLRMSLDMPGAAPKSHAKQSAYRRIKRAK